MDINIITFLRHRDAVVSASFLFLMPVFCWYCLVGTRIRRSVLVFEGLFRAKYIANLLRGQKYARDQWSEILWNWKEIDSKKHCSRGVTSSENKTSNFSTEVPRLWSCFFFHANEYSKMLLLNSSTTECWIVICVKWIIYSRAVELQSRNLKFNFLSKVLHDCSSFFRNRTLTKNFWLRTG